MEVAVAVELVNDKTGCPDAADKQARDEREGDGEKDLKSVRVEKNGQQSRLVTRREAPETKYPTY